MASERRLIKIEPRRASHLDTVLRQVASTHGQFPHCRSPGQIEIAQLPDVRAAQYAVHGLE